MLVSNSIIIITDGGIASYIPNRLDTLNTMGIKAYSLSIMVWKVMISPSFKVEGSQVCIKIRSPESKVGDIESDCTARGV